ncbi:MAG: GntR family transcriptional regulator [Betaproteobacteria bacterium]|nr:GntR family transcriptional regulator [Betaproteobacteria bacterium]
MAAPDLVEQVYDELVKAISSGALAPSHRITQEQLAAQFEVSRQPVLQALRLLKRDGLVLDAPGRGVQIAPLEPNVIAWVYQLRGALDALAASLAADKAVVLDATLIESGRHAAATQDLMAFHQALYQASGNPLILSSAKMHWCHIRRVMGEVLRGDSIRQSVWDEHEAIAQAVAAGDVNLASSLSQGHGRAASAFMIKQLLEKDQCNETDAATIRAI